MTRNEFEAVMDDLRDCYGERTYSETRCDIIFEKLNFIPFDHFRAAARAMIARSIKAPMLQDFESIFSSKLAEYKKIETEKKLKNFPDCRTCGNVGVQFSRDIDMPHLGSYAFQCDCQRGAMAYPAYPKLKYSERINPKSEKLNANDIRAVEEFKSFLNDPRASLFRRLTA